MEIQRERKPNKREIFTNGQKRNI